MKEFNIGNRVRVVEWDDIPSERKVGNIGEDPRLWNKGKAKTCGKAGTIVDKCESQGFGCTIYHLKFDESVAMSKSRFIAEDLISDKPSLNWERFRTIVECEDNVVIVRILDDGIEVARGHAHFIHEGVEGYTQAVSYASKRAYLKLTGEDNTMSFVGRRNYLK